jgi:hypothetical protein
MDNLKYQDKTWIIKIDTFKYFNFEELKYLTNDNNFQKM